MIWRGFVTFPYGLLQPVLGYGWYPLDERLWTTVLRLQLGTGLLTSIWLWLYGASVVIGPVLLRMNDGVGFLLRVTDVENQPFRSMGFVSVLIVSGLFLLGLPFVLL